MRRRDLLRAGLRLGLGASTPACLLPSRPGPRVVQPAYPMGPIPPPRGAPGVLFAGAAHIDITPPEGARVWLAGFGFSRPMRRVLDRISARALYLDDGVRRVALVVADVVGLMRPSVQRVRRLIGPGVRTVVASTHSHAGPDTMGYWGPSILHAVPARTGIDVGYLRVLERRLAAAVAQAAYAARPARLAVRAARVPGDFIENLRTPGDVPERMIVAELRGLRSEAPICTLVNFGCHPETLGARADGLSADFPGPLRAEVEAARGGVAMFVNGALGGMLTPRVDGCADAAERRAYAAKMGRTIGAAAAEAAAGAPARRVRAVDYAAAQVGLPVDNPLYAWLERTGLIEARARDPQGRLHTEVGRLRLGDLTFGVMPGEPSPAVGRQVEAALGAPARGVIGLGNDELGYLLTPAQFADPAFSYEVSVSPGGGATPALIAALEAIQAGSASSAG